MFRTLLSIIRTRFTIAPCPSCGRRKAHAEVSITHLEGTDALGRIHRCACGVVHRGGKRIAHVTYDPRNGSVTLKAAVR